MLMVQMPVSAAMGILLASFITLVFNGLSHGNAVHYWWLVMIAVLSAQYLLYLRFKHQPVKNIDYQRWLQVILFVVGLVGVVWSVGLAILLSMVPEHYHIFLIILLISLASAGITFAVRIWVYIVFQVGVLLPVIIWLLFQENVFQTILAIFLIIFMVAMWLFAMQLSRTLSNSFQLQLENLSLANSLKQSNARLHVLNEELTQLSATDSMTQVANRRYFDNRFVSEFSRASRDKSWLSLIMVDVDYFKAYNDKEGHVAGDECLKKLAICIRNALKRPTDLVARYGGEEFVVLLPSTETEGARLLAEEIRKSVIELKIKHPTSSVLEYVTVSLGVTGACPGKDVARETMLKKADKALYKAKAAGRNNVQYEPISD